MANSNLKFIGIILFLIGFVFIPVNFVSPRTVLVQKSVQVPHEVMTNYTSLASMPYFTLSDKSYKYFPAENISAGQTLQVDWYSDIWLGVFVFSQEQFSNFQSIFANTKSITPTPTATQWANMNGITYEAVGWANKNGEVAFNVTESGNYVAVITNAMYYGGAGANIYEFNENLFSYQTQFTR